MIRLNPGTFESKRQRHVIFVPSPAGSNESAPSADAEIPAEVYEAVWGAVKVPTLRNVDKRPRPTFNKSFGHNGYFDSLESVVHFYNTRDVLPYCATLKGKAEPGKNCWPVPEVADNVNTEELGKLGLTAAEEAAVVAFIRTLSDQ